MTTEFLTYGKTEQPPASVRSGLYCKESRSRKNPVGGSIASSKAHALETDGWSRKISVVLAHLKHAHKQLTEAEIRLAAQQERIALLEDLATTDDLTGLKNRRGFYEGFTRELECCERGISKGGLIVMIDLDNFKTVNDTFGHQAGDAVLKLVGKTLMNEIRKMDIAARLGGDEFVLLLSNTLQAATRAQTIGWHLNNLSLAWNGDIIPVQASVGLKSFGAGDMAETVLRAADGTLYETKFARKHHRADHEQGGSIGQAP